MIICNYVKQRVNRTTGGGRVERKITGRGTKLKKLLDCNFGTGTFLEITYIADQSEHRVQDTGDYKQKNSWKARIANPGQDQKNLDNQLGRLR